MSSAVTPGAMSNSICDVHVLGNERIGHGSAPIAKARVS